MITPYTGYLTNKYASSSLELKDTGEMNGLYAQWIDTDKFQANIFYYRAPNVNYSLVNGLHLNADYYLLPTKAGKYAVGAGMENLYISLSAGNNIPGQRLFDMDNEVLFCYVRGGRYFYFKKDKVDLSVMPYAGLARESVNGDLIMERVANNPSVTVSLDDKAGYGLLGLNIDAVFAHFLQVQAKWMGRYNAGERLDEYSLMANIFVSRHWGLSYRYKYMEYNSESNEYNLFGVAYSF
ncbi:MAG TPA: hypothetical protein DCZ92_00635 [Elusimicrobia bacterium]|nr:MAG: hypothetical protein A2016_09940 [Elusimicrobia bacterium GWF2_62_30]HBA59332.1 hypothetical protein [Elusimicrobiota bacterium]